VEPVVVEVLDEDGTVLHRERVAELPFEIGRAYDCAVVVDDPHVCPRHIRVEESMTGLVVRDVSEVNGLARPDGTVFVGAVLEGELELRAGATRLRLRGAGHPVPPAIPYRPRLPSWRRWSGRLAAVLVVVAFSALVTWEEHLGSVQERTLAELLEELAFWPLLLGLWSGTWAFASRALRGQARWLQHLAITCGWIGGLISLWIALSWILFWLSADRLPVWLASLLGILGFGLGLRGHLALTSRKPARRQWLSAAGVCAFLLLIQLVTTLASRDDFEPLPHHWADLEPIPAGWLPTRDLERVLEDAESLRRAVDSEAAEESD
jgi:hypothetical protein